MTLKTLWMLHIDGCNINNFSLKNFKWLNVIDLIVFKSDIEHLIEALRVTAICIWTDREIRL